VGFPFVVFVYLVLTICRALKCGHIGAVGLDVYEKESAYFFADSSSKVIADDTIARLLTFYNVFMTYVLSASMTSKNLNQVLTCADVVDIKRS